MQDSTFIPPYVPGTYIQQVTVVADGCERAAVRTIVVASNGSSTVTYVDASTSATLTGPFDEVTVLDQQAAAARVFITNWCEFLAGGGGGGAATIANGANVAEGSTTDGAITNPVSAATMVSLLKGLLFLIQQPTPAGANAIGALVSSAGTWVDHSTTITAGGTRQQLAPAAPTRKGLLIQNPSGQSESIWFTEATAVLGSPSIELAPGGQVIFDGGGGFVPVGAIDVIAATTGHPITCRSW